MDKDKLKQKLFGTSTNEFVPSTSLAVPEEGIDTFVKNEKDKPLMYKLGELLTSGKGAKRPEQMALEKGWENLKNFGSGIMGGKPVQASQTPNVNLDVYGANQFGGGGAVDPSNLAAPKPISMTANIPTGVDLSGYDTSIEGYKELGKAQEKAYTDMATQRAEVQKMQEDRAKAQQVRIDEYNAKMNKAYEDYANQEVSIDKFWADRGTGSKILAGIGVILGGIGQMKGAQTNTGLDVINKAIEQDLAVQKANIEKKGRSVEMQRGILADQMKNFDTIEEAEIASKMLVFQQLEDKLKAASANPQAKVLVGQLQAQKQAMGLKLQGLAGQEASKAQALEQTFRNLDILATESETIGLKGKVPYTDAKDKVNMMNAAVLSAVAQYLPSPRLAKDFASAYTLDTNDLATGEYKDKIKQLKKELQLLAMGKKDSKGISEVETD